MMKTFLDEFLLHLKFFPNSHLLSKSKFPFHAQAGAYTIFILSNRYEVEPMIVNLTISQCLNQNVFGRITVLKI